MAKKIFVLNFRKANVSLILIAYLVLYVTHIASIAISGIPEWAAPLQNTYQA
jgi:hypothetical protein